MSENNVVSRYTTAARINHWITAISLVLLAVSGLALFHPSLFFLSDLFGGGVSNDFAFTFLVGIVTGTYSSIYIASSFVLWYQRGERPKMATTQISSASPEGKSDSATGRVPARA